MTSLMRPLVYGLVMALGFLVFVHLWTWAIDPKRRFALLKNADFDSATNNMWFWVFFVPFDGVMTFGSITMLDKIKG